MNGHEQQGILWSLASSSLAYGPAAVGGPSEPTHAGGPVVAENALHGAVVAAAAQPAAERDPEGEAPAARDVEGVRRTSGHGVEPGGKAPPAGDLGVLGGIAVPSAGKVHPKTKKTVCPTHMRIADVTRLLNSTPLGRVISERQIFRHRIRSMDRFRSGYRHINFPAYVAWLLEERFRVKQERDVALVGTVNVPKVLGLLRHQDYRCALTGRILTPDNVALDHVLPMSRGGKNLIENAQALHKDVNRAKATLTNEEFIQLCREVVAWADSHGKEEER